MITHLLCTLMLALPSSEESKLGRLRAEFGDKPNSGKWKYVYSRRGSTIILFPAGRADKRFYWTPIAGRLCCESKQGNRIRLDWMIKLQLNILPTSLARKDEIKPTGGAILTQLVHGWLLPRKIPARAKADLAAMTPLAAYSFSTMSGPFAWFETTKGETGQTTFDPGDTGRLPKTSKPYPITPQERAYLATLKKPPSRLLRQRF